MNSSKRDRIVLGKIVEYCDGIEGSIKRFGSGAKALDADSDYRDSVSMKILQIGELTTQLSAQFKESHNEIPWQDIKDMRNIAAHGYHKFDNERAWGTMTEDIPALREYCQRVIEHEMNISHEEPNPEPEHTHEIKF